MNDLKANLLLSIDNMTLKKIIINLVNRQAIFGLCDNAAVKLNIIFKLNYQVHYSIYSDINIIIPSYSKTKIPIHQYKSFMKLLLDRDYIFKPASSELSFYIHTMNIILTLVHA